MLRIIQPLFLNYDALKQKVFDPGVDLPPPHLVFNIEKK